MKTTKQKMKHLLLGTAAFLTLASSAFAQGGSGNMGGGGSGLKLIDDEIILADPFYKKEPTTTQLFKFSLPPEVLTEAKVAIQGMEAYAGYPNRSATNTFFYMFVDKEVEYYAVKKLPRNCPYMTPILENTPAGSTVVPIMCTFENKTYVIEEYFKRLSIRDQTKLVIHEAFRRFRSIFIDENQDLLVSTLTAGADTILRLSNNERKGLQNTLTDEDLESIKQMVSVIHDKKVMPYGNAGTDFSPFNFAKDYSISRKGGAIIHKNAKIDPTAYAGISQVIGATTVLGPNAKVLQSDSEICLEFCSLAANAEINGQRSGDYYSPHIILGEGASLKQVKTNAISAINLQAGSTIEESEITLDSGNALIDGTYLLSLGKDSHLKNLKNLVLKNGTTPIEIAAWITMPVLSVVTATTASIVSAHSYTGWYLSGFTLDGSKPSLCESQAYAFIQHTNKAFMQSEAELYQNCMSPRKASHYAPKP